MKNDFDISTRRRVLSVREGITIPSNAFSALLVDHRAGFVYVSGDMKSPQCAQLNRGHLFVDEAIGPGVGITSKWMNQGEPLSVLGVREIKAGAAPNVPILLFEKADVNDPDVARTLRGIPHATLLVWTDNARDLFDACMMHAADSAPGKRSFRTAAEDLALQALKALEDLGEPVRAAFLKDNLAHVRYPYREEIYVKSTSVLGSSPSDAQTPPLPTLRLITLDASPVPD